VDRDAFAGQLALLEEGWNRIRVFIPGAQTIDLRNLIDEAISRTGGFMPLASADCSPNSTLSLAD
jgi:hypothetical protein